MIKAVIFDIGGVIVKFSNADYYKYISRVCKIGEPEVRRVIERRALDLFESGKMTSVEFERFISKNFEIHRNMVQWYNFYKNKVKINPDVVELIKELHETYITAYITNIDRGRYNYTLDILDRDDFDFRFASCYMGIRKPNIGIYKKALKEMHIKPEEAVFIDNMQENVIGARKAGMHGVLFESRRMLDISLSKLEL